MVNIFNHLPVLNKFGEGDQDYLLYHLPRYRGEANWSILCSILLLAFLEDLSSSSPWKPPSTIMTFQR